MLLGQPVTGLDQDNTPEQRLMVTVSHLISNNQSSLGVHEHLSQFEMRRVLCKRQFIHSSSVKNYSLYLGW